MTTPGFDVLLASARYLEARAFIAGTGSTTGYVVDSTFSVQSQEDDMLRGGTLLAAVCGAATRQIRQISESTQTTVSVASALASAPTSGDLFYALGPNYPPSVLTSKLSEVLLEHVTSVSVDTSLITVAGQREYTAPTITTGQRDLVQVELAVPYTSPIVYELSPGSRLDRERDVIVLDFDPIAGLSIRLRLSDTIPANVTPANLDTLNIPGYLPADWLALEVASRCAAWRLMQTGDENDKITEHVNDLRTRANVAARKRGTVTYTTTLSFTGVP